MVFDTLTGDYWLPLLGEEWINLHPQYCRSNAPEQRYDIMVQHNHGSIFSLKLGKQIRHHSGMGMDIHVIHDDGTNMRDFPWGRAVDELAHGHQCWIGRSGRAIEQCTGRLPFYDANGIPEPVNAKHYNSSLISAIPGPRCDHRGKNNNTADRVDLTQNFQNPYFCHFATDINGTLLISDGRAPGSDEYRHLFIGKLIDNGTAPIENWLHIADTRSWGKTGEEINDSHTHPFLSPDGTHAFFNSNESGILRPYIIKNIYNLNP